MERETRNIQVGEHTFVVKTYATAREAQVIRQAYLIGTKVEVVGDQPKISEFNVGAQAEVEKELIRQLVVSFDGDTENLVERCLELPSDTYDDLIAELDGLVAKKKK